MEVPVKEFNHEVRIWMPRNWVVTRRRVSRTGRLSDKTEVIPTVIEGTEAATGEVYSSGDCKLRPQELNRYRQQRNYFLFAFSQRTRYSVLDLDPTAITHLMLIREDYQYLLSFKVIDMHCRQINCPRSNKRMIVVIVFIPALSKVVTNPAPTMPTTFTKSPSTMCRKPTPTSAGAGGLFSSGPSPSCGTQFSGWAWSYLSLPKCPSRPSFGQTPSILTTKSTRSGH